MGRKISGGLTFCHIVKKLEDPYFRAGITSGHEMIPKIQKAMELNFGGRCSTELITGSKIKYLDEERGPPCLVLH